jgi:hypothetical protein
MKVTFFKSINNTAPANSKDVVHYLDRIREGKSKEIIKEIRVAPSKEKASELKKTLPLVCFNGEFTSRGLKGLKKPSGLMVLDFDDVKKEFKETLKKDRHIFAAWESPSGGVKALYKIPPTSDPELFKKIFQSVCKTYTNLDKSGSDIPRVCFESYDPELYYNPDAEIFTPVIEEDVNEQVEIGVETNIPLEDQDQIANRLMVWFKKKYNPSQRNNSIFKLASAFNSFGVQMQTAMNYCSVYAQKDFDINEIQAVIKSAYKNVSDFNTKHFEDGKKKKEITNYILSGKRDKEIFEKFGETEYIKKEVNNQRASINTDVFWSFKKNEVHIEPYKFKLYLHKLGFYKYYPSENNKTFIFIRKDDNFIKITSEHNVKDVILKELERMGEIDVFNKISDIPKIFSSNYLSLIDTIDIDIEKDTKEFSLIYYQNCVVQVHQNNITLYDYDSLEGYVWEDQVIKRNYLEADHHESMYRTFIWLISGENVERYNTFKSVIGYLLHTYKTSLNNRAIILNDEMISENPNGGSGKGLFTKALSYIRKTAPGIDGKMFDTNKSFAFQTVPTDCQILPFEDVKKNFNFESLFSLITEGITIEYKGRDAIKIPVEDSPKIIISTNYTIKAEGGSFERRMFEVELSSYFNSKYTPYDEFKCMLFDEWNEAEWARFDKYMVNCIQFYLKNGLVTYEYKNLKTRKIINDTSSEFMDWADSGKIPFNERIDKKILFEDFVGQYDDYKKWLKNRTFNKWLKTYADYKGAKSEDVVYNGIRYYYFKLDGVEKKEEVVDVVPF